MTPIEEVDAAIVKLTASKPSLRACPEFNYEAMRHVARNADVDHECTNEDENCGWQRYDTAPAFDMLIRTIDAQLVILGGAKEWLAANPDLQEGVGVVVNLARAINGITHIRSAS